MMKKKIVILAAALFALVVAALPAAGDTVVRCRGQSLYVPVYSHIYSGDKERPFYLAVTLSVRNTDPRHSINLSRVDYYDTDGKLLRRYLEKPLTLGPAPGSSRRLANSPLGLKNQIGSGRTSPWPGW
ncbi:MAG: DUF3124 domain-containing protein [Desulfobacteraceae bacterium]|jgi:hypothetical protein|nr:DUF3124 domain-containing protein [Desulfobacteraceae bacterium]